MKPIVERQIRGVVQLLLVTGGAGLLAVPAILAAGVVRQDTAAFTTLISIATLLAAGGSGATLVCGYTIWRSWLGGTWRRTR